MGWFSGKKGLVLGVFNEKSLGWAIAEQILKEGGECGFTYFPDKPDDTRQKNRGRLEKLTQDYPGAKFLIPMNVQSDADIAAMAQVTAEKFGKIDFLAHAIAFAPPEDLGRETIQTSREGFKTAMDISAYSLIAVVNATRHLFNRGGSIVTLTYYGGEKIVPGYNVMGICKAALDCIVKYLAFDLGPADVRVNAVSAGPVDTISGRGAGVRDFFAVYEAMAPMQRNITHEEVGKAAAFLLSDHAHGITAEIMHVDSGYNAMGTPGRMLEAFKALAQA